MSFAGGLTAAPGRRAPAWPLLLLLAATAALMALQGAPRPGQPVVLVFAAVGEDAALRSVLAAGWRPVGLRRLGPLLLGTAAPDDPGASAALLRRRAGAWFAIGAQGLPGCTPLPGPAG